MKIADEVERGISADGFPATLATITRFAVLAFAPAEHSRAALFGLEALATIAPRLDSATANDQLVELARYAAAVRRPWSEAPITEPPPVTANDASEESVVTALETRDRLAAERWIAAVLPSASAGETFFDACARISDEMPDALRVGATLWRLAQGVPAAHRFGVLRAAAVQWTADRHKRGEQKALERADRHASPAILASSLIKHYAAADGSPEALARIAALDAALYAHESTGSGAALELMRVAPVQGSGSDVMLEVEFPGTRPQLDFSGALIAWSIAERRRSTWLREELELLCHTAAQAARSERWHEEWSI